MSDEQEALSHAYAIGVRIIPLSSGRFAVFDFYQLHSIVDELSPTLIQLIVSSQLLRREKEKAKTPVKPSVDQLLKELGL